MESLAARDCVFLAQFLLRGLDLHISQIHFFLDSQIALYWTYSSKLLKHFVRNMVSAIRNILDQFQEQGFSTIFHDVASEDDPTDFATHGVPTNANGDMWWNGPSSLAILLTVTTREQEQELIVVSLVSKGSLLRF
ncbi:hypothetical protein Y032_0673g1403 [Ancylostoma ceylanicum]|uniref:RNase H type-1 domain-containing protein n=1 Tax=Ancylostoma ceylanicum TaxID=53326 RepID=A0A016WHS0_9BILA|nr:hypothetical protein Y032_0673g1403 [Ancylostoma ceylanicum]